MNRTTLEPLVVPFGGTVCCHAPADRPFDLDALDRADDGHDRWSSPATRTTYLAGDPLTALAEFARHGQQGGPAEDRRVMSLRLMAVTAIDLRRSATRSALDIEGGPEVFLDRGRTRELSRAIRTASVCEALIVPSMAFLDRPDRFNVVIFCEALDRGLGGVLTEPTEVGRLRISP